MTYDPRNYDPDATGTYPSQPQDPYRPTGQPQYGQPAAPATGAPGYPQAPYPPVPPAPKKRRGLVLPLTLGVVAIILITCGILAAIGSKQQAKTPAASAATTAAASQPAAPAAATTGAPATKAPAAAGPKQLLKLSGNGIKKSALFTTGDEWKLAYTFDCTKFGGGQGNFQVYEYTGGNVTDVMVNELAAKGGDSVPQHSDSGQHYLQMNSECSWTITITG